MLMYLNWWYLVFSRELSFHCLNNFLIRGALSPILFCIWNIRMYFAITCIQSKNEKTRNRKLHIHSIFTQHLSCELRTLEISCWANFYATRELKKRINKVFKTVHPKIQDGFFCVGSEYSFAIKRFVRVYIFVKDENQVLDAWGNSFNVGYSFQKYFLKQIIWNLICSNCSKLQWTSVSYYDPAYSLQLLGKNNF